MEPISEFDRAFEFTYKWEKGLVNDPADPGGLTKDGISDRSDGIIDGKFEGKPIGDLTLEDEKTIYKTRYWEPTVSKEFSSGFAICVFDTAVNCGVSRANRWTLETKDPEKYLQLRREYYQRLVQRRPAMQKFLKGWLNRVEALHKYIT